MELNPYQLPDRSPSRRSVGAARWPILVAVIVTIGTAESARVPAALKEAESLRAKPAQLSRTTFPPPYQIRPTTVAPYGHFLSKTTPLRAPLQSYDESQHSK